ncbi:MAG: hypothetical protein KF791_01905 [Verrucomicrobiae bacterium]|nr:hypothetical protein [Verrucomicrobiae bacterium]
MDPSPLSARRAAVEDLAALQALWQEAGLPWEQLGDFLNEFQIVTDEDGLITGVIGLLIEGDQALLHTEAIHAGADADLVRAALWRRVQIVLRHQGVQRVWTQEDADYWKTGGFSPVPPPLVERAPASFLKSADSWLACDLMDPERAKAAINEQLAILEAERMQRAAEFQQKVRLFRTASIVFAFTVVSVCLWMLYRVVQTPGVLKRLLGGAP